MSKICPIYNVPDESDPDLHFFYTIDAGQKTVLFDSPELKNVVSQRFLYPNRNLDDTEQIGFMIFNALQGLYGNSNTYSITIRDIKGGFQASHESGSCGDASNPDCLPLKPIGYIKPNSEQVCNIYTGNDNFLNANGFMVIKTDETSIREVFVYFNKCK